jgi:hypothetical protein
MADASLKAVRLQEKWKIVMESTKYLDVLVLMHLLSENN